MEDRLERLELYRDMALAMAWPDMTARGDESWMAILKRIGIVKNLNFKVGHAAIILINRTTGQLAYYDFGRYVTPRGYGRARSAKADPRLVLTTRARFGESGTIANLEEICNELDQMEAGTHGGGRLFFSVATGLSYISAEAKANEIVDKGPVKYGALARGNNSCSRFVAQVLLAGFPKGHAARNRIALPECVKPSPMSNVANAAPDKTVYCFHKGRLTARRMSRWQSLRFQIGLLAHNLSSKKSKTLPCDREPGNIDEPARPVNVSSTAYWLGGIGEGAWYLLESGSSQETLTVVRYGIAGQIDYRASCEVGPGAVNVNPDAPYAFTYQSNYQRHVVVQHGQEFTLHTLNHSNDVSLKEHDHKITGTQNYKWS